MNEEECFLLDANELAITRGVVAGLVAVISIAITCSLLRVYIYIRHVGGEFTSQHVRDVTQMAQNNPVNMAVVGCSGDGEFTSQHVRDVTQMAQNNPVNMAVVGCSGDGEFTSQNVRDVTLMAQGEHSRRRLRWSR